MLPELAIEDEPAPRAAETLGILKARGLSLGIVSNNTSKVRGALEGLGLERSFGSEVISEEVGLYKPDPAILELACKQLGAPHGTVCTWGATHLTYSAPTRRICLLSGCR